MFTRASSQLSDKLVPPTFVHALNVFVSFTPLLSLYKTDCSSVNASWTKRRCSSSRQRPSRGGTNRLIPMSLWRGRHIGPQIDTGPEDGFDSSTAPGGNTGYCMRMHQFILPVLHKPTSKDNFFKCCFILPPATLVTSPGVRTLNRRCPALKNGDLIEAIYIIIDLLPVFVISLRFLRLCFLIFFSRVAKV
jgi:hypothetical protein